MNDLIHTDGEGVNSTIIQCVHEQSLTGKCIFPVFYLLPMDHLCTNRLLKQNKYSELEAHETLKRVNSANAILKHYKSSSLITVKRHVMVLSFFKS